ncbi:unnamed protein product [Wuchereria bancrofti]|nr:unnamed protein product [Wuchereria bancrofti]
MEEMETKFPSKLFQYSLNEQSEKNKMHSNALFEEQKDENIVKCDKKFDQKCLNDENAIINLSVKQRAQMYEAINANKSIIPKHNEKLIDKLDNNYSSEFFIQKKMEKQRIILKQQCQKIEKTFAHRFIL